MKIPMEDWLRGCVYHDGRTGEVTLPTDKVLEIANYIQATRTGITDGDGMFYLPPNEESRTMTKTIDAVKVVRCRECEYWKCNPNTENYGTCEKASYDDFEVIMEGDDFCSYGIRKREEMTKTLFMNLYNCEKFENLSTGVIYMKIPKCSIYDEIGREVIVNCVRQDNFECCFTNAFEQVERIKGE